MNATFSTELTSNHVHAKLPELQQWDSGQVVRAEGPTYVNQTNQSNVSFCGAIQRPQLPWDIMRNQRPATGH